MVIHARPSTRIADSAKSEAPIRIRLGFAAKHMHTVQSHMTAQDTQRVPGWANGIALLTPGTMHGLRCRRKTPLAYQLIVIVRMRRTMHLRSSKLFFLTHRCTALWSEVQPAITASSARASRLGRSVGQRLQSRDLITCREVCQTRKISLLYSVFDIG